MSHEIRIPRLGWSMEEGTFVRWLKEPGDPVRVGDLLFELEGDKATQAVESLDAGILHVPAGAPSPGEAVVVGTLLGYLLAPGEPPPRPVEPVAAVATVDAATPASTPAVRAGTRAVASPRARRVARELGIDWTGLRGSGRDGRVREADVRGAAQARLVGKPSRRRQMIAERLRLSQSRTVPVTLTTTFDATNLVACRNRHRGGPLVPSYTDIVAWVVAGVLERHPHLIRQPQPTAEGFDIAVAVHTDAGLLAPVLRGVGRKPLLELAAQSSGLIERARAGTLTADELRGGAFTITNLGAWGIDAFTPVINYPELAILGLGAIRREAVVLDDGTIAGRERMTLSLTFDHAELDGVPAAEFLRDLAAALADVARQQSG